MAERRSLIEGLDAIDEVDPQLAEDFIYGRKPRTAAKSPPAAAKAPRPPKPAPSEQPATPQPVVAAEAATSPLMGVGRVPMGARVRTELAATVKRASLERQLAGIQPNSIQDILEESFELWLLKHGYLK